MNEQSNTHRPQPEEFGFGDLFNLVSEAVVVADAETGTVLLWNEAATRVFGYEESEAIGMPVSALVPEELRPDHLAGIARFRESRVIQLMPRGGTVEVPAVRADGSRIWVELSLTAMTRRDNLLALALIRDVTDRHRAQEELARANQALRDFVAVAAHDLRSPAATTASGLELLTALLEPVAMPEGAAEMLELVERQARGMLGLISDLLDTAALDSGSVSVRPEILDVAEAVDTLRVGFPELEMHVPNGLRCKADSRHVSRILTNLVSNAFRHGKPPVTLHAVLVADSIEIRVTDGGAGVPSDLRARLFDAYVARPDSPGTGLGLSIARGLARANEGDLTYRRLDQSTDGFVLSLPAAS